MTVFTDKCKVYIPRLMKDLNITKAQASGIFGNLGVETGGFTALQEKSPIIKGSKGGYGWMQWTGPRRRTYEAWCKAHNYNPALDETNYQYLVYETLHDEYKSLVQLRKTTTVEAATETFMKQNLRPGVPHLDKRIEYAKKAFAAAQDQSKSDAATTGAGAVIVATGGGAIAVHNQGWFDWATQWPYWVGGAGLAIAVTFLLVHLYHVGEQKISLKKGKK